MDQIYAQIKDTFRIQEFPHALFYAFDYGLRFDLPGAGFGSDRPMRRFLQAHQRASVVAEAVFGESRDAFVLLSSYGAEKPDKKRLKPLKQCGMKRRGFTYLGATAQQDDDHIATFGSDVFRHWDIAKLTDKGAISDILWLGIAGELGVAPAFRPSTGAYLVDLEAGVAMHLYDDRGMDVIATHKAALSELYGQHRDWLLNYDLARMDGTFGDAG